MSNINLSVHLFRSAEALSGQGYVDLILKSDQGESVIITLFDQSQGSRFAQLAQEVNRIFSSKREEIEPSFNDEIPF